MSETWGEKTDAEVIAALDKFAVAQEHMAANCGEDWTHWHHMACAHLYAEAATRLRKRGENCTVRRWWNTICSRSFFR